MFLLIYREMGFSFTGELVREINKPTLVTTLSSYILNISIRFRTEKILVGSNTDNRVFLMIIEGKVRLYTGSTYS